MKSFPVYFYTNSGGELERVNASRKTLMKKGNTPLYIAIICLIILLGCATKDVIINIPDEEVLSNRVAKYWDHNIKEEFDMSYNYEDPLFRKKTSMIKYIKNINTNVVKWVGADIENLRVENDVADVDMKLKIRVMANPLHYKDVNVPAKEKWIRVDEVWYHVP